MRGSRTDEPPALLPRTHRMAVSDSAVVLTGEPYSTPVLAAENLKLKSPRLSFRRSQAKTKAEKQTSRRRFSLFRCLRPGRVDSDSSAYGAPKAMVVLNQCPESTRTVDEYGQRSATAGGAGERPSSLAGECTHFSAVPRKAIRAALPLRRPSSGQRSLSAARGDTNIHGRPMWSGLAILHACTQPPSRAGSTTNSLSKDSSHSTCTSVHNMLSRSTSLTGEVRTPSLKRFLSRVRSSSSIERLDDLSEFTREAESALWERERAICAYLTDHVEGLRRSGVLHKADCASSCPSPALPLSCVTGIDASTKKSSVSSGRTFFGRQCSLDEPTCLNFPNLSYLERSYMMEVVDHWQRLVIVSLGDEADFEHTLRQSERNGRRFTPRSRSQLKEIHRQAVKSLEEHGGARDPTDCSTFKITFPTPPWAILPLPIQLTKAPHGHYFARSHDNATSSSHEDEDGNEAPPLPPKTFDVVPATNEEFEKSSVSSQMLKAQRLSFGVSKLLRDIRDLDKQGWYWGPLGRRQAEEKLKHRPRGTFLVRDCSDRLHLYCASVKMSDRIGHVLIKMKGSRYAWIDAAEEEAIFDTLPDMIEATTEASRGNRSQLRHVGGSIFLLKGLSRFERVPSLQHLCRFTVRRQTEINFEEVNKLPLPKMVKAYLQESDIY